MPKLINYLAGAENAHIPGQGKVKVCFYDCETKRKRLGAGKNVERGDGRVGMRMEELYLISRFPPSSSNALKSLSNIHQKLRCK